MEKKFIASTNVHTSEKGINNTVPNALTVVQAHGKGLWERKYTKPLIRAYLKQS